jgi:hypothetical protein
MKSKERNSILSYAFTKIKGFILLINLTVFTLLFSSFHKGFIPPPYKVKFPPMLWEYKDFKDLTKPAADLHHLVFELTNSGAKDSKRRTYELVVYAYDSKNKIIPGFNAQKLQSRGPNVFIGKDMHVGIFVMTKQTFDDLQPTNPYTYLRFDPFENTSSSTFTNYVSYKVKPVGADGSTGIEKLKNGILTVPEATCDPSPPAPAAIEVGL